MKLDVVNWNEGRLSRRPYQGPRTKLDKFNTEQREKGLRELSATKGWLPPPRREKPATPHENEAKRLVYAFLGYGP